MSEKLTDPNKAAHEIVEVRADGCAVRKDGMVLQPANKNPWYVLATIYGEQPDGASRLHHDKALAKKNGNAWNQWFFGGELNTIREGKARELGVDFKKYQRLNDKDVERLTMLLRKRLNDNKAVLPDPDLEIDFSGTYFDKNVCFIGFEFSKDIDSTRSQFSKNALFYSARFWGNSFFIEATFGGHADFRNAVFCFSANFREASFSDVALFEKVIFGSNSCFSSATYYSGASYEAAAFKGHADFDWYEYIGKSPYPVRFFGKVDFSSAKFEAPTTFVDARFATHVPEFHGAELFEKTLFPTNANDDGNWPTRDVGKNKLEGQMSVEEQAFEYNRLQLFMNKTMRIDEEQFFHRMEMRCKGKIDGGAYGVMHAAFDAISEYGNNVVRPVQWLFCLWFIGWVAYWHKSPIIFGEAPVWEAAGWSFANIFSIFGFRRLYFDAEPKLHALLQFIGGVQTVAGFVLLFLLGLGLRNRFRLR